MNKNLLKNPWILAGLHLLITIIIGLILNLIDERLNIKSSGAAAAFLAALTIGQIYTFKLKELISKKLRLKVSSIAIAIQFALGILLGLSSDFTRGYFAALTLTSVIVFFGIYFGLGVGGKGSLKLIEKIEKKKMPLP